MSQESQSPRRRNPYAMFGVDDTATAWLSYEDDEGQEAFAIEICRAGSTNPAYLKALDRRSRALANAAGKARRRKEPTIAESNAVLVQVFADVVVKSWRGVTDRQGNAMPFNRENVVKLFTDLPDLFQDVLDKAQGIDIFQARGDEADAKN